MFHNSLNFCINLAKCYNINYKVDSVVVDL